MSMRSYPALLQAEKRFQAMLSEAVNDNQFGAPCAEAPGGNTTPQCANAAGGSQPFHHVASHLTKGHSPPVTTTGADP